MALTELDRKWWTTFTWWVALLLIYSAWFVFSWAIWPREGEVAVAALPSKKAPDQDEIGEALYITLGCTVMALVVALVVDVCLNGPPQGRRRRWWAGRWQAHRSVDSAFGQAAWAAVWSKPDDPAMGVIVATVSPEQAAALRVLGLAPGASRADVRRAFRALIRRHHPDRGGRTERARELIAAYKLLTGDGQPAARPAPDRDRSSPTAE